MHIVLLELITRILIVKILKLCSIIFWILIVQMLVEENIGKIAHVFGWENLKRIEQVFYYILIHLHLDGKTLAN